MQLNIILNLKNGEMRRLLGLLNMFQKKSLKIKGQRIPRMQMKVKDYMILQNLVRQALFLRGWRSTGRDSRSSSRRKV